MKTGDYVETPRFLKVKIVEVYTDNTKAMEDGFTEPTHYRDEEYHIRGKHTGPNTMIFAAIRRN
jgi:hypothetical protein